MKARKFIGLLLMVSGFTTLYLGELFNTYQEEHTTYWFNQPLYGYTYPYQNYALPLAVIGIVLLVASIIFIVTCDEFKRVGNVIREIWQQTQKS